ncbi:hypothetical protein LTR09_002292 [Extremus antarcticus]|uniref:Galactose oxidase n=1 Tax=Extremus antarcticus TaxID=702011 RepID=A0AAJ0LVA4_9PEZI|nr:hypothetical protein LTR09_002292 [Extremus antarcticus]
MIFSQVVAFSAILNLFCIATIASSSCQPNTWLNLTSLPSPRQEHTTVAIKDETIAVIGGITSNTFTTTDLMQLYDVASDTWRTGSPVPYRVNHPNAAVVGGEIYLLGGLIDGPGTSNGSINFVASGKCYKYIPTSDTWVQLEAMPSGTERGSAVIGVRGEMVYLAGGMSVLQNTYQDSLTTVTAFNTTSGKWQRLPPAAANIPHGRQHAVGSVLGDVFYVLGGRWFGQMNVRGTVFELNLKNQSAGWRTSLGHMLVPRGGLCGDVIGSTYYTFGGEGNPNSLSGVFNETEAFDVSTQRWTELMPMAVPRHGTHAAAIGNRVYIPGGGLQQDGKPVVTNGSVLFSNPSAHFDVYCVEI